MIAMPHQQPQVTIAKGEVDALVANFCKVLQSRLAPADTLRGYKRELQSFLNWLTEPGNRFLGHEFSVDLIAHTDIRAYLAMLHARGLANSTRAKALAVIRTWLNYLGRRGDLRQNVAMLVSVPRASQHLPTIPSIKSMSLLLDLLPGICTPWRARSTAMMAVFYGCNLLPCELVQLNECDIDWTKNEVAVTGRRPRRLPMGTVVVALAKYVQERAALLAQHPKSSSTTLALFVSMRAIKRGKGNTRLITRTVQNMVKQLTAISPEFASVNATTLRFAGGVHMLDGGADLRSVAKLMGVSLTAAERMEKLSTQKLKEEVDRAHPRGK